MDAEVSFGEVLKRLRTHKKLRRLELAQIVHVSPSSVEKWERGDVLPDRSRVEDLIRVLELLPSERRLLLEAHAGLSSLPSLHNLPTHRNLYFTDREEILEQLHHRLTPGNQLALTQAIIGLGGIGKTQVALHYAYRFQKAYSHVLWVSADSPPSLVTEFVKLARDLELPEKDEKDQDKIVRAVQRWLREHNGWLLVFDNVEDLSLVASFIPSAHQGAVILTTRRQATEPVAQSMTLNVLSGDEGALFLLRRTNRLALDKLLNEAPASEVMVARAIVHQLGGLPLALDQAGSYITETACSLSQFLDLFRQRRGDLLSRRGSLSNDHPASVATTFALVFEQVQAKNKAAIELLKFCSFLAPDAIPLEIIAKGAVHLGRGLKAVAVDALQFDQVLEVLQAYSLVRRDGEEDTLSIHRLVQAVLQGNLEQAEAHMWAVRAVLALNAAFPNVEHSTWPQCERLLSHALLAAHYIETNHIISKEAGRLLQATALYLKDRGRFVEAEPLYQRALRITEQQLGPEHPEIASSLNGLANLYYEQGKYSEAEPLYQHALRITEQQLGPEHPEKASSLNGLANLYYEQGKYSEAEPLYQRALRIREQQLGKEMMPQPANNIFMKFADTPDTTMDVIEIPLLLFAVQSLEFLILRPDLVRKIVEECLKHCTQWGREHLATNKAANGKSVPRLFQDQTPTELLINLLTADRKNQQVIASTLHENLTALFDSVGESEALIALDIALALLWATNKNTREFALIDDLALDYFEEGHHEVLHQLIIDIIEARFINHSHIVALPTLPLEATKAQVTLLNGSVMIKGKESELVIRIANTTSRSMGEIHIELTRSAEYDFLTPSRQSIPSLPPYGSVDVCFQVRMKVAKQVSINYLVNGEMRDPPLSIYASRDNPYVYGSPVDEGDFFGRQEELLAIVQAVTKPAKQDILVVGERRSGKTSLLYQIIKRLDTPFISVYIILNTCRPRTDDVLDHILHTIVHKLMERHILDSVWQRHEFASRDFSSRLEEVVQAARKVVQDLRLVLLIDEADFLLEIVEEHASPTPHKIVRRSRQQVDERVQRVLRAALQAPETGNYLRAVVAGTSELSAYMLQHSSPFFNHFRFVHLKPLSREETHALIVKPAEILGITFQPNAIQRISSLSGCQPYYCQALCYETFAYAQQQNNVLIGNEEVDVAEQKICADLFHAFLSGIWRRAKPKERAFLTKLVGGETTLSTTEQHFQQLLDWQILSRTQEGYRFSAVLFERWTAMAIQEG